MNTYEISERKTCTECGLWKASIYFPINSNMCSICHGKRNSDKQFITHKDQPPRSTKRYSDEIAKRRRAVDAKLEKMRLARELKDIFDE